MVQRGKTVEVNPQQAAQRAGLRYIDPNEPGIRRVRTADGFEYRGRNQALIRNPKILQRIRSLAIPPAWENVWICPDANGHLQATGFDAKGRKQYRYHPQWRQTRDSTKYEHMLKFAQALPEIRVKTQADLTKPGLPREKVLALLVQLLEQTLIRVGNEEYATANGSFGLTTLRNRHVDVLGSHLHFHFRGKSGRTHDLDVIDRKLAKLVQKCRELPGQALFQYVDAEGKRHVIGSGDVNAYLRGLTGDHFTAKDFRTWAGTRAALAELRRQGQARNHADAKAKMLAAIEKVAQRLGNTPAVCRKCYIHPAVLELYLRAWEIPRIEPPKNFGLEMQPEEREVMAILQKAAKM